MPPRKDHRMAAAVEAMEEMGFPAKQVRQTVNKLLKLYGKDDHKNDVGWRFIEDCSYKELVEALLRNQTDGDQTEAVLPQPDAGAVNNTDTSGAGPSISKVTSVENDRSGLSEVETSEPVPSSISKVLLPCSNLEAASRTFQSKDDLDSSSHNEPLDTASPTQLPGANNCFLPTEGETQGQQETPVTLPTRKRRPYHGWIGSEDDDLVVQTEAPLSVSLRQLFILPDDFGKRKRKSRWDVTPENI